MILNELITSGPLAKVWLSAHQERKLSKTQALGVDVGETVEAILTQDETLPLRSSGPLMLGVVRIYSRKVGYLFDDCREARERISLAFRPGVVDLPEEQVRAAHSIITIPTRSDFDFNDWSWGPANFLVPPQSQSGEAVSGRGRTGPQEFGAFNFGVPRAPSLYGGSVTTGSRHGSHDDSESSSHIGSNDFSGIDLGLNLDGDDTIEYGRDVMTPISREGSAFGAGRASREKSIRAGSVTGDFSFEQGYDIGDDLPPMAPMDDYDMSAVDRFEPMDLGLDFGQDNERDRRASTELLTPPPSTPPAAQESITDLTPRTAAQISAHPARASKPAKRARLVIADDETEIAQDARDRTTILGEEHYIPFNTQYEQLHELMSDPASHFFPSFKVGGENWTAVAPLGLAPELAELFAFPTNILRKGRRGLEDAEEDQPAKRARKDDGGGDVLLAEGEADDPEVGRRDLDVSYSDHPDHYFPAFQPDVGGEEGDDYGLDIGDDLPALEPLGASPSRYRPTREDSLALSRAESVARDVQFGGLEGDFTLAIFDSRSGKTQESQFSQATSPGRSSRDESWREGVQGRNSSMAMGLLRKELEAIEEGEEKRVSFEKLADKASKRAASAFFFELLSLGTRDCIKIEQPEPFGDIQIIGKDKLWPSSSQMISSRVASEV